MAQQFPLHNGGDNDSFDDLQLGPVAGMPRQTAVAPQQMNSGGPHPVRSTPIAIKRNPEEQQRHLDSSDDEDDGSTIDVEMDALKIASTTNQRSDARSLPSHLLRAPKLHSLPSREDWRLNQRYPTMLPPAMKAADQPLAGTPSKFQFSLAEDRGTSYGSLRESHTRGKFLDGPSSYRDKQTGDIRQLQHKVRFENTGTIASSLPSVSIGERIMKSRQRLANASKKESKPKEQASSLSALMEASDNKGPDAEPAAACLDSGAPKPKTATFYDEEMESQRPQYMLSTSLTGLEVLQAGLRNAASLASSQPSSTASPANFGLMDAEELPRDANDSNNAILPRSFSDPMPQNLNAGRPAIPGLASPALLIPPRNSSTGNFQQLPHFDLNAPEPTRATRGPALTGEPQVAPHHLQASIKPEAAEDALSPSSDHNPDTDCVFDFEME